MEIRLTVKTASIIKWTPMYSCNWQNDIGFGNGWEGEMPSPKLVISFSRDEYLGPQTEITPIKLLWSVLINW